MAKDDMKVSKFMPNKVKAILKIGGNDFIKQVGIETVRQVVHAVLCGENLRDSTETITRKRIAIANAGVVMMFLEGCHNIDHYFDKAPELAVAELKRRIKQLPNN